MDQLTHPIFCRDIHLPLNLISFPMQRMGGKYKLVPVTQLFVYELPLDYLTFSCRVPVSILGSNNNPGCGLLPVI